MVRRHDIDIGGGGALISASGVESGGQAQLTLSMSLEAQAAGARIIELIRAAIARGLDRSTIQELGRYVYEFPDVALRVPELHELLLHLTDRGQGDAVDCILGQAMRGRPRTGVIYAVQLVAGVMRRESWPASKAARWVAENHPSLMKDARSLENDYSRWSELLRLGSRYIPAEQLTTRAWPRSGKQGG